MSLVDSNAVASMMDCGNWKRCEVLRTLKIKLIGLCLTQEELVETEPHD